MPSQQPKRYAIKMKYDGKLEIEYYVDKYVNAFILAKKFSAVGHEVIIYDRKTKISRRV